MNKEAKTDENNRNKTEKQHTVIKRRPRRNGNTRRLTVNREAKIDENNIGNTGSNNKNIARTVRVTE